MPYSSSKLKNALLQTLYYRSSVGFGSIRSLYRRAKLLDNSITYNYVRTWLHTQPTYTLHGRIIRKFKRRKVISMGLYYQMQADLIDVTNIRFSNNHYKYILTCIDVFSRRAFAVPIKRKTGLDVKLALCTIFKNYPPVKFFQVDSGTEFYNHHVRDYLRSLNTKMFSVYSDVKACLVERFNRTLRNAMYRYFTANNTTRYVDILSALVLSYNRKIHRSIGMAPLDVTHKNERSLWMKQYGDVFVRRRIVYKFNIGDNVRVTKLVNVFGKGYKAGFTSELFVIIDRIPSEPVTYRLRDKRGEQLSGVFYDDELKLHLPA